MGPSAPAPQPPSQTSLRRALTGQESEAMDKIQTVLTKMARMFVKH